VLYRVKRVIGFLANSASWDTSPWQDIPAGLFGHYMGKRPEHFPKTEVKMAYDDTSVFVMFRVEDRYVRAIATRHQENVCGDSCVEFFFSPGPDVSCGYFNLEMN
jgi:hypothetical protein